MDTEIAGKLSGIVALVAGIPYVWSILRGRTKPSKASWFIWAIVGIIMAASYKASGAKDTMWLAWAYAAMPIGIALLSLKYGKSGWSLLDTICVIGAFLSLVLWAVFKSPVVALVTVIVIDVFGCLPTVSKAYHAPETESLTGWTLSFIASVINMFAIEAWRFEIAIYPIYMLSANSTIAVLLLWPKIRMIICMFAMANIANNR